MPYCRCGNEFSEARARLGFDYCLECGKKEAAAEIERRAHMIAPISHKSGYTYLGPDRTTQRQRLLEGTAKTPRMETGAQVIGQSPRREPVKHKRYELAAGSSSPTSRGYAKSERYFESYPAIEARSRAVANFLQGALVPEYRFWNGAPVHSGGRGGN
jgi:hypothetical protein